MESSGDKLRALLLALALHLLCAIALLGGLWWTQEARPIVMPGPVIEAVLVGPTAAPAPSGTRAAAPRPPARPQPEPPKPAPKPPEPAPPKPPEPPAEAAPPPPPPDRQDTIERERVAALAREKAEQEKKEQQERVRREQILLEEQEREQQRQLDEIRKKREAAEQKLRDEQARMKKLEADRKAAQQAAEAERAEKAAQAAAAAAEQRAAQAQSGAGGQDNDLAARYAAAIQVAVTSNWNRPDSAQAGLHCALQIKQIPGGDVISVQVVSPCNADAPTRTSIEQAVMRAAPLPYQGYEKVFQRQITFNFKYDG